ncbi:MAG: helix-turn-helix domain-containing protein [Oscillospiraceae bacterium]|nr:helix-turn-helix domain-containing protein [Oscillospiraceae bacterium]
MVDVRKNIAANITKYRKLMKLSQKELAEAIGAKSFTTVSTWERGGSMPDVETISKLCILFGISVDELFGIENAPAETKLEATESVASALGVKGFDLLGSEYWDLKYPDLAEKVKEYDGFRSYLESLGYIVKEIPEPVAIPIEEFEKAGKMDLVPDEAIKVGFVMGESYTIELSKDGKRIVFTEEEFNDFENSIKESVEYQIWKKQQK